MLIDSEEVISSCCCTTISISHSSWLTPCGICLFTLLFCFVFFIGCFCCDSWASGQVMWLHWDGFLPVAFDPLQLDEVLRLRPEVTHRQAWERTIGAVKWEQCQGLKHSKWKKLYCGEAGLFELGVWVVYLAVLELLIENSAVNFSLNTPCQWKKQSVVW